MKIAVAHNLPPGGQKRALFEQVKLLSQKHTLDLYTLSSTNESFLPLAPYVRKHETVPYTQPKHFPQSVFSLYTELPQAYKHMAAKIDSKKYDVVLVNPCYLTQAPYILRYLATPSLYYCCEPKREFYEAVPRISNRWTYLATLPFRLPLKTIDQTSARAATRVITCSHYAQEKLENAYGVSPVINYLGVDTSLFRPTSKKKENMVITVGEFSLLKGHDFIIRSLALISEKERPKLVIIGPGGIEKSYLEDLARSVRVHITFLQNISDSDLVTFYNRAKAFVYAPLGEPFGLVLLEAAACGLPVVAVAEGGVKEILSVGHFGVSVARNEAAFSQAVQHTLSHPYTKEKINAQYAYVKKVWSWDKSVSELEKYLSEIKI